MEIFSIVATSPTPLSPTEVSEKLGIDNDTAGRYLRRLAQNGFIKRAGRGLYESVSEVSEEPKEQHSDTPDTSDTDLEEAP
jgi:DNA-binding IclR family transcriptional regulator